MTHATYYVAVSAELKDRGWTDDDIEAVQEDIEQSYFSVPGELYLQKYSIKDVVDTLIKEEYIVR